MITDQEIIYDGICEIVKSAPCSIVIFGASGDLTRKKLISAVFSLYADSSLPENFYMMGFARTKMSDDEFREMSMEILKKSQKPELTDKIEKFLSRVYYTSGDYDNLLSYLHLKTRIEELNNTYQTKGNVLFNLSTPPSIYTTIIRLLSESELLVKGQNTDPFQRIIIEKPFGRDYETAVELNSFIEQYAKENQVYRIDHYLGKDTVQNIYVFRFANTIFEPIWNRNCIDHVQITVAEDIGIGNRAGYFDETGLMRDMLQNHLLQLLCCVAMEPPPNLRDSTTLDERKKLFKSIRPFDLKHISNDFVIGQYAKGTVNNQSVNSYREEKGVKPDSLTETYFATRIFIDNWRWQGVPFYLRCGKRLNSKLSKISVVFKKTPASIFRSFGVSDSLYNTISFNIYPEQGASIKFQAKLPEHKMCIGTLDMNFNYKAVFGNELTSDYNSLFLDCLVGDRMLFWSKDNVELSWEVLSPAIKAIEENASSMLEFYPSGTPGPASADKFIQKDNRKWIGL